MSELKSANPSVSMFDIGTAISEMESTMEKPVAAHALFKTIGIEIMLIVLDIRAELKTHSAPGPISVQVVNGSIEFRTDTGNHQLSAGQILTLEANIPHSVFANERSAFIVTKSIPYTNKQPIA